MPKVLPFPLKKKTADKPRLINYVVVKEYSDGILELETNMSNPDDCIDLLRELTECQD